MVDWYVGTMGFSWRDWSGPFYPTHLASGDYLSYYSRVFNAVEIDSTFYGTPRPDTVRRWAAITPPGFKVCAKVPRLITHELELAAAQPVMKGFLDTIRLLEDRLGVILIQFPPSYKITEIHSLAEFLRNLPEDLKFAVEFRHRSWFSDTTEQLLNEQGVAWAATEYEQLPKRIYPTTTFLFLRFIGRHHRFKEHVQEQVDPTEQLVWWRDQIQEHLDGVAEVFGFFNNDYSGFAPATANRFKSLVGLATTPLDLPPQGTLF